MWPVVPTFNHSAIPMPSLDKIDVSKQLFSESVGKKVGK